MSILDGNVTIEIFEEDLSIGLSVFGFRFIDIAEKHTKHVRIEGPPSEVAEVFRVLCVGSIPRGVRLPMPSPLEQIVQDPESSLQRMSLLSDNNNAIHVKDVHVPKCIHFSDTPMRLDMLCIVDAGSHKYLLCKLCGERSGSPISHKLADSIHLKMLNRAKILDG